MLTVETSLMPDGTVNEVRQDGMQSKNSGYEEEEEPSWNIEANE